MRDCGEKRRGRPGHKWNETLCRKFEINEKRHLIDNETKSETYRGRLLRHDRIYHGRLGSGKSLGQVVERKTQTTTHFNDVQFFIMGFTSYRHPRNTRTFGCNDKAFMTTMTTELSVRATGSFNRRDREAPRTCKSKNPSAESFAMRFLTAK